MHQVHFGSAVSAMSSVTFVKVSAFLLALLLLREAVLRRRWIAHAEAFGDALARHTAEANGNGANNDISNANHNNINSNNGIQTFKNNEDTKKVGDGGSVERGSVLLTAESGDTSPRRNRVAVVWPVSVHHRCCSLCFV